MKVRDYVRFDYHRVSTPIQIAKITETHYDNEDNSIYYLTDIGLVIDESNLVKEPSPNIIDLIEVGDYVNGRKIEELYCCAEYEGLGFDESDDSGRNYILLNEIDIKSVVTKEQFESMEYKVGD